MKAHGALLTLLIGAGVVACGSAGDGSMTSGSNGSSAGTVGSGGGAQTLTTGGSLSLGTPQDMPGVTAGTGGSTAIEPGMACATGTASASLSDVRMLVMFDRSGSMNDEADENTGASRWDLASAALSGFFQEPSAGGLQVALRFFPHDEPADGCNDDDCDVNACAEPLVPLAVLSTDPAPADAHEAALVMATAAATPPEDNGGGNQGSSQGTPISAALSGALAWAAAERMAAPEEKAVVVLVTDGEPNGCEEEIDAIAQLSADAFASAQILTYAIGLTGSQESDMDAIAAAGGTTEGIFISDGATAQQELLAALTAIRGSILDCDFPMPEASGGLMVDPSQINVNYTPAGGMTTTLGRVPDAASCGTGPGWYYDNPQNPTTILLCPESCNQASGSYDASLEILLGCVTRDRDPA
jgi:hypothetical protein